MLTFDEARRIAANIAKLPKLLSQEKMIAVHSRRAAPSRNQGSGEFVYRRLRKGGAEMLRNFSLIGALAVALLFPLTASAAGRTNPGLKSGPNLGSVGKSHTNPGGKSNYRGYNYSDKLRSNPGGKYVHR
jgi:hypothetical protein